MTPEGAGAEEKAIREIIYATACQYEGHEHRCNVYGCTLHNHPEVKRVRSFVRMAMRAASAAATAKERSRVGDAIGQMQQDCFALGPCTDSQPCLDKQGG